MEYAKSPYRKDRGIALCRIRQNLSSALQVYHASYLPAITAASVMRAPPNNKPFKTNLSITEKRSESANHSEDDEGHCPHDKDLQSLNMNFINLTVDSAQ